MEIMLIRHGRPASEHNRRLSSAGFSRWVRDYNRAVLHPQSHPRCQRDLKDYYIMSSKLRRAKLSAQRYTSYPVRQESPLLNEMQIPRYRLPVKLAAWNWIYLNRALWMLGQTGPFESFSQARARIRQATEELTSKAAEHEKVCVFAHAMTNRFVARYLQQQGWTISEKDHRYWGIIRLHR